MTLGAHLRSAASLLFITLNLAFWSLPLFLLGLLKLALPPSRAVVERAMAWIYRTAVVLDDLWLGRVMGIRWSVPDLGLDPERSYLVLANHVSWSDILLLQSVITRQGPLLKFLAKRELIYVPILGLVFWAFDFPILRRRSRGGGDDRERRRRDLEALHEACRSVRRSPAAIMNFAEGTRFAEAKREQTDSPYRHLLRPRVGGLLALIDAIGDDIDALIDLTLIYPGPMSFWGFLAGGMPEIEIRAARIDPKSLPRSQAEAGAWLADRWARKDAAIEASRAARAARGENG